MEYVGDHAATVFMNWLLTKKGQAVFSQSFGSLSLRIHVTTERVPAPYLPQPGEKLFYDSEEDVLFRGEMRNVVKEIIEAAAK